MIKSSVKIDEAAIARKIEAAKTSILEEVKNEFKAIARDAVRFSPVDTGAFVTSWSFETGKSGRPRGKSSLNRPRSCLLYTSPSPRDQRGSRMPSSA